MRRKAATLVLGLVLALTSAAPTRAAAPPNSAPAGASATAAPASFSDLAGHWAQGEVARAVERGLVSGYPDGTFRPDAPVTRAEFVKLAVASRGLDPLPGGGGFADLEDHWVNKQGYITAAVQSGLIVPSDYGTPPRFEPDRPITRLEVAVIASRALNRQGANWSLRGAPLPYTDAADMPYWASGSVAAATSAGVLMGYPDGSFGGNRTLTRAEAVTVANRLFDRRGQTEVPVWEANSWHVASVSGLPSAEPYWPSDVAAAPDGTLYVLVGNEVWRLPPGSGAPSLFYRHPANWISAVAAGPDAVYVGGGGGVWKLSPEGEAVLVAGTGTPHSNAGWTEELTYVNALCTGPEGGLFVIASSPSRILQVMPDGEVRVRAAADPGASAPVDGPAGVATVYLPSGCAVDQKGNLYFADVYPGRAIRRLAPDGSISWVAGYRPWFGYADGTVEEARFGQIADLAVDDWGNLWVVDAGLNRIRRVSPDGHVHTVAGSGFAVEPGGNWLAGGHADGPGPEARFSGLTGIALAGGKLYVTQTYGAPLRVITGSTDGYAASSAVQLVPLEFGNRPQPLDPLPLPAEPTVLPIAFYTPVVKTALLADGLVVYQSGSSAGPERQPLSPVWPGGRPGTYQVQVSAGLPSGLQLESAPVTARVK
ncbi:MAG TPA: S-layer homology domain-containing protein [Symbiobacteriaceae bacterium]